MKKISALILSAIFALPASAKPFYKTKSFWVGTVIIVGDIAADYGSTARNRGVETNFLLGPHPSIGRIGRTATLDFLSEGTFHILFSRSGKKPKSKFWTVLDSSIVPTISTSVHIPAAVHNFELK